MSTPAKFRFHLIPNAHLDPVWLWDWREGMNEAITTCRTVLDLMDEFPQLTFIRGESAIYEHLEKYDPATFKRIKKMVKAGRWDCVGGSYIQPDTNLPQTETFIRHYQKGQRYFLETFGQKVNVAWAADSFGHSAGLPEILLASGFDAYCFGRPQREYMPLPEPAFWWEAPSGQKILSYRNETGWYGCERDEMGKRLDIALEHYSKFNLTNCSVYFGLGNHGGGPIREHILDIEKWKESHPEVEVIYSGLHRLIDDLQEEALQKGENFLPTHKGDLGYCLRGCYVSMGRFKNLYRKAENEVMRAENTATAISAAVEDKKTVRNKLDTAWESILFNSFHDILPGSSVERTYIDQSAWTSMAFHLAQKEEFHALNLLSEKIDTTVNKPEGNFPSAVPIVIWNPHPYEYSGPVEFEINLDYRPVWAYRTKASEVPVRVTDANGKVLPHQKIAVDHLFFPQDAWRTKLVVPVKIPAFGWTVVEAGWVEGSENPTRMSHGVWGENGHAICSEDIRIEAYKGKRGLQITKNGKSLFDHDGLTFQTFEDVFGSWGGHFEEAESIDVSKVIHQWHISDVKILDQGPEKATLWVKYIAGYSGIDLTISLYADRDAIDCHARVLWNERAARLKMILPCDTQSAEFEVPGGTVKRGPSGEVPGGRWVKIDSAKGFLGFASDSIYGFDIKDNLFRASLLRSSRYAQSDNISAEGLPWAAVQDLGEHQFKFILTTDEMNLERLSDQLEQPLFTQIAPPSKGEWPRSGGLLSIQAKNLSLLALKASPDKKSIIIRLKETAGRKTKATCSWLGKMVKLGEIKPYSIATFRLNKNKSGQWTAIETTLIKE